MEPTRPPRYRYQQTPTENRPHSKPVSAAQTPQHTTHSPHPASKEKPKQVQQKERSFIRKRWWQIGIGTIVVLALAAFVVSYLHNRSQLNQLSKSDNSPQSNQQVINEVGKIAKLPEGETPTVATVNGVEKLKNQVFFENAQDGDKVLIYTQAKTAVLYRPSIKKIIAFAPVNASTTTGDTTQQ